MSERPLLVDLYCGIGGAAMGYYRAGFDVIGVDHMAMPEYPFPFFRSEALEFLRRIAADDYKIAGRKIAAFHASPPCQKFVSLGKGQNWQGFDFKPDALTPTRVRFQDDLADTDIKWVIENVPGAPMGHAITLCGSMFDLRIAPEPDMPKGGYLQRHRKFESNILLMVPGPCNHEGQAIGVYGNGRGGGAMRHRTANADQARRLMGIDWASRTGLTQAIPPAFTEYIGKQLLA